MKVELTETLELAIRIAAEVDAIHLPPRQKGWGTRMAANLYFARERFKAGGVPVRSTDSTKRQTSNATRVAFADLLKRAAAEELLVTTRTKSMFPLARLTAKGDEVARAICGLPGAGIARMFLADLKKKTPRGKRWVSEFRLAGKVADWGDLFVIQNEALPALWRGWVEAGSTVEGEFRYALTPAGLAALKKEPRDAFPEGDDDPFQEEARAIYRATFEATLGGLMNDAPENLSELGEIPLSIGED